MSTVHPALSVPAVPTVVRAAVQAEVAALEEDIQALQKQLEETELECVYTKAQIATLARLSDRTAAAAALPADSSPAPDAPASQPGPGPQQAETAADSEVRVHKQRTLPAYTPSLRRCPGNVACPHPCCAMPCMAPMPLVLVSLRCSLSSHRLCWLDNSPWQSAGWPVLDAYRGPRVCPSQDDDIALDLEAATAVASIVAAVRGAGQPHTTPASCRLVNAAFVADLVEVQCFLPLRVMDAPTRSELAVRVCFACQRPTLSFVMQACVSTRVS